MKICINGEGHMTKMATMTKKVYDFETCHEAPWIGALQILYKS